MLGYLDINLEFILKIYVEDRKKKKKKKKRIYFFGIDNEDNTN